MDFVKIFLLAFGIPMKMKNNMPPKCPHCKVELEYEERMRDQNEGDYYYETWRGHCPKCNKTFQWDEVYNFSYCDSLEEVKELE